MRDIALSVLAVGRAISAIYAFPFSPPPPALKERLNGALTDLESVIAAQPEASEFEAIEGEALDPAAVALALSELPDFRAAVGEHLTPGLAAHLENLVKTDAFVAQAGEHVRPGLEAHLAGLVAAPPLPPSAEDAAEASHSSPRKKA